MNMYILLLKNLIYNGSKKPQQTTTKQTETKKTNRN